MQYLVLQISLFLVLAAGCGFVVAWLLRGVVKPKGSVSPRAATTEQLSRAREAARAARADFAAKVEELDQVQQELAERNGEIEVLVRELQSAQASTSRRVADKPRELSEERGHVDDVLKAAGLPTTDTKEPGARPDELTKIRGIGPVTERLLNELGYTTFRQIANWTGEDIERIAASKKSLRAKIERDEWPKWARQRFKEIHGKDLA